MEDKYTTQRQTEGKEELRGGVMERVSERRRGDERDGLMRLYE